MAIGPRNQVQTINLDDLGKYGCNYDEDITSLQEGESPNAIDIEFDETVVRKRFGYRSITTSIGEETGYASYSFANSDGFQKLVTHQGINVYSLSNLEGSQTSIRTSVPRVASYMTQVNSYLIHTFDDYSTEYYWDGTTATMAVLSADAPGFKHATESQGYILGGNIDTKPLRIYYEDTNDMIGGLYEDFFTLSGGRDDEKTRTP